MTNRRYTIGVETSGVVGSVALCRDDRCVEEVVLPQLGRRHAQSLVPELMRLLDRHSLGPGQVSRVAVSVGPGSFTGLRVGVTFAKTFAYATGAELIAVDSFSILSAQVVAGTRVSLLADGQRAGVIWGRFVLTDAGEANASRWRPEGTIRLVAPQHVADSLAEDELVAGPAAHRLPAEWRERNRNRILPSDRLRPSAAVVAKLAVAGGGTVTDPFVLEPAYVRRSGAEEVADARDRSG